MYRKKSRGWYKHKDFILIDLVCLFMALILAYLIRNGSVRNLFTLGIYRNVMIFVILVDLFLIILFESYKGVLRRGRYQELRSVIRQMILIELASGLYLFTVSGGHTFSRIILYLMGIFYVLLSYCTRIIWKKRLLHKMAEGGEHSLYIVTNYDLASKVIQNVKEHNYNRYNINGLILIDKDMTGKEIAGVPVVADLNNAPSFICQQWVDEVFVNVDETYPYSQELIEELLEMGMPVHVNLAKVRSTPGQKQFVEAIGGYTVLTTTMNYATDRQALAKRVLDILGGLVGCFLTGVIFIFIAPAIYISSPGPIFFSQTRIGKNGKPFKMYKFRSMYMDAEERKAELMAQNKMSDGRMFKLDFDPRVIGNKILPDGTRKTGIGEFIRKTSLDEFPQFWNVLNGSMSLVGTRPILQDELRQYELHHRARIAIKPGITGMWQVSGRSDITDFEEVDGGSKDGTINLIKKYIPELEKAGIEVNYKSEPDKGISDAFNKGIQRSSGDIIGIINSDDQLMDEALMKIADAFTPTVDIVCGDCLWIDAERNLQYIRKSKMQLKKLKYEMVLMHPTCFVRRTAYEKWGYFDINLRYIMDKDLMARFYSRGANFEYTPNVIVSMSAGGASDANAKKVFEEGIIVATRNGVPRGIAVFRGKYKGIRLKLIKGIKNQKKLWGFLYTLKSKRN